MPRGGVSTRAARRSAAPWWEELDSEAFREFPAARRPRITRPAMSVTPDAADATDHTSPPNGHATAVHAPDSADQGRATNGYASTGAGATPGGRGIEGRRTVTIRGHGAERNLPVARPTLRRHERPGFRPDRAALWAVLLGVLLILVAAASAHAAVVAQLVH
jgi:hypothetical protein